MSQTVAPQIDVGSVTLQGLAAFTPILAALSADNVHPMALQQIRILGTLYPTNGKIAGRVPDLLQRSASQRLQHLGAVLGWRKGDSASFLAQVPGGQAIALLCMCLMNMFSQGKVVEILHALGKRLLSPDASLSSRVQLVHAAEVASSKLAAIGFGNELARQLVLIHDVYTQLGRVVPHDFLFEMTIESACELLYSMSKALRKNGTILRITGTQGMGYILCLAAIMFPEDVSVTVDGLVVREGLRECVLIEIVETSSGVTEIHLEQIINSGRHETSLPIVAFRTFSLRSDLSTQGCFDWSGWIAAYLELNFLEFGLKCPRSVLMACCNLLYNLFFELDRLSNSHIPGCRLGQFLGPYPARRIRHVCERVWGVSLQDAGAIDVDSSVKHSMDVLAEAVSGATSGLECPQCPLQNHDDPEVIWQHFDKQTIRNKIHAGELVCNKCCLWIFIRACLGYSWNCLFVNPKTSSTITPNGKGAIIGNLISITRDAQSQQILSGQGDLVPKSLTYREIYQSVVDMFAVTGRIADFNRTHQQIAWGCGSSTLYAVAAEKLDHPWNLNFQFDLVEGQITDVGEHYVSIGSRKSVKRRRKARDSMTTNSSEITPSCLGEHSRISVSVVGCGSELQVHTMAYVSGKRIEFDLAALIIGSWEVEQAKPCIHDPKTTPLKEVYANDVVTTSVAKPLAKDKMKVAIAQTQSNRVAQFLCGQPRVRALWQKDCCLNCAFEQAKPAGKEVPDYRLIICG